MCRTTGCSWLQPCPHSCCKHRHPQKSDWAAQELHGVCVVYARETDLSFLPWQSWNPPRAKEEKKKKKKAFRSRVGGKSTSPSPIFPRDTWRLPGPAEKISLPPFSDQRISRVLEGFPGDASGKNKKKKKQKNNCLPMRENLRDTGSMIPGLGRSPGGGHGNPLQYSCLENPRDRGAW